MYYHIIIDGYNKYFNKLSPTFEAENFTLSSNMCPSIFFQIRHHDSVSLTLCPMDFSLSTSSVFKVQNPEVLYCRILLMGKLKTLLPHERKETARKCLVLTSKIHANSELTKYRRANIGRKNTLHCIKNWRYLIEKFLKTYLKIIFDYAIAS